MTITMRLPAELRDAVAQSADLMLRLYDDQNDLAYVVVPEALFERLAVIDDSNPLMELQYAHVSKALGPDGLGFEDVETVV